MIASNPEVAFLLPLVGPATVAMPSLSESDRLDQQGAIQRNLPAVFDARPGLNPRFLSNNAVAQDLIWLIDSWRRLRAIQPSGFARLSLPESDGITGRAQLLDRVASLSFMGWLRFSKPVELEASPKIPTWRGQPLANPFLTELDGDDRFERDRAFLKRTDPQLADFLRLQAQGGPTFEEFAEMQTDNARLKAARAFRGKNPFDPSTPYETEVERTLAQKAIWDSNGLLGEMLKTEAGKGRWNPMNGANRTQEMTLWREDSSLAFVLAVTAGWRERQLADELRVAEVRAADARTRASEAAARAKLQQR